MADRAFLERLSRELTDQGKLIEAGWVGLRLHVIPPNAPAEHLNEMRMAFFAGAQHLFTSIVTILEPGVDETENDLTRMDNINEELRAFAEELELRISKTKGSA